MSFSFAAGDEVGQTGWKFERGSTRFFAVTLILTSEPHMIREGVESLRRDLRLPVAAEFKFHSTPRASRLTFLERAATWPLMARALYVDKQLLPVSFRKLKSWEFYGFFVAELMDRVPLGELGNTTLVLDEFGSPKLTLHVVREELRRRGLWGSQSRLLKRMVFRRSQSEAVIQVADMFGGALYRWLTENDEVYYQLIKSKSLVWAYHPLRINPLT